MLKIFRPFDLFEDRLRTWLSRHPIIYGAVAGFGAVLFFRGIWVLADHTFLHPWYMSAGIGSIILLLTGVFVSHFVSDRIILSGLRKEKKFVDLIEQFEREEQRDLNAIQRELKKIKKEIKES